MTDNVMIQDIEAQLKLVKAITKRIERQRKRRETYPADFPGWKGDIHQIEFSDADSEIATVFIEAKLDPNDPVHWRAILEVFCKAYVKHKHRPDHRAKEWHGKQDTALAAMILKIRLEHSGLNDTDLAKLLKETPEYNGLAISTLRRHIARLNFQRTLQLADEFPVTFKETLWSSDDTL